MDEKQLQALFNEMKSKLELGDFATFKSQIGSDEKFRKAFYNEASVDLDLGDFNAFNESFKKKVSTTPSAKPAPVSAPVSPSKLPSPSALTYNDIELVIEDTRKKARRLQDLREAPMASAGIGAPGMVVPKPTLDQAAQELKLAEDKKKEVLTRYQGELARPVERLIETGEYKSFFTQDGVFDEAKARDYFKKVTQKYGGGSHLQDQWLVNLKTRGQQEIDKPRFNQILGEEMKKNNLDLKQYSTQVFNQLTQEQRTTADSLKKERDAEALKLLNGAEAKAKQYADELNKAVNSLNDQIKAGVITNEEAAATYDQLVKQYETTIKGIDNGYKDAIRKMNVRINGKFDRIEQEVRAINSSIDSEKVMQSLPPDVRKRLETAYQAAGQRLSAEKNEAKKKQEEVTGIGTTDVISRNINLALKSLTSGFNRGLAEVGEYLNMKGLSGSFVDVLRNRRTAAETFAPAQYEWNKDEWLKRAISSTGTSLGASVPILLPTIGAVALTGGGAAGALAAGALSFAGESAQIGGGQFREGLEETGDVVAATKRAEEVMRQNTITAPLYFIGGLGDVMITTGKGLSKVATGIALEQAEEIPTEYIQSFNEAKAKGYNKGIGDFIKENPEIAADTFISTVGQSGAMKGIASAFSVFQKNVPASTTQMLTDAVSKNGVEFTNGLIDKWFEAGKINQKTVAKLKAEVAKIQTQLPKMQEAGVDVEKAKLMSSLSSQSQELQNKINAEKDPAVKALYQNQLNVINQDISQLVKGETPYVVFTLPGGGEMTRVMTVREFNALPAESSNDMIKNSDGIKVVGDDALNTQLTQKKQQLGVPEAAPGVFTQAPAGPVKIENPTVVITGTRNGLENLESNNYDPKTGVKIKDARGRMEQFQDNMLIEEDGQGNTIINIKADAVDNFGRDGFLQASVVIPKGAEVDSAKIKRIVDAEVQKLNDKYNGMIPLGKVQQSELTGLKDAVVKGVQGIVEVAPAMAPAAQEVSKTEEKPAEQIEKKEAIKQKNEFITDADFVQEAFTPEEDVADREALPESQFKTEEELSNFLETGEYAMLTGQNPEAIPLSKEANRKLNEKAQQWLSSRGLTAVPIFGKYGNSERSFMVPGMTKQQAIDFAKEFQQDSVAHSSGLVYQDGSFNPRKKGVDLSPKFEQGGNFFSTINVGGKKVDFSIEFEDARVQATKPVADRLRTEIFGDTQKKVASAQKALEKTGVVIQMIEDPNEFDRKVTQLGGQRGMEGVFLSDTGEILINQQKLDQGIADGRVIWHEASHPVVNIVRNTNPQLFGQVVAGLRQAAADNKGVADALAWAESQYAQDGQGVVDDEAVVETIAGIAEGMIDITKLPTGLKQSIIDLINRIARALGFDQVLDDTDIAAFKKLASDVANALTTGQDISEVVGAENVKEYLNTVETPGLVTGGELATAAQARLTTEPAVSVYDSKEVSALPQKSLDEVYNQFGGKAVVINSDPTRVGELTLPSGKKIFMYGGPAYLSIKDNVDANVGFATTQTGKVNTWMKYVKEVFGDNPGVTLVASQAPTSILSNSYALRYVMDAISMLPKSVLRSSDFKNEFFGKDLVLLKDAFGEKAYNEFVNKYKKADLSDPKVIDDMIAEMGYKVGDDNKPASFKARGAFVSNLVGGIADKASLKGVEGDKGYVSKKPNKYIAKQLMDRLGINAEKIMREIGEPSLVDLYMNEGNWGFAVAGFETDPNMTVEAVQQGGVKHPLFNAKFPGKNPFILDGAYELNKMFTPVEITGPSGMPYTKTAAQMLAGSMYVKGQPLAEGGSFEYVRTSPAGRRIQERRGNLVADAGLDNKMTSDDQGNYIFYHYSDRKLKAISPSKFGKNLVTGRDERPGIGISMYYTRPDVLEVGVPADYGYAVRVPEQSVYPFNEDPLDLLPAAEQEFNKKFPGQAFDLNKQVAFVTQEAAKRGYPMTVAEWNIKGTKALRAQTTEEFKPEVYRELVPGTTNQYKFNPELDKFKPNRKGRIQARAGRPVVGQIDWQRSPEGKGDPSISARSKVVTQAAADLKDGKITNEEYRATVSENSPIMPITRFFEPATEAEVERSLDKNQAMKANTPVEDGTKVGLRLDIPAYKNNNTWVVSVHEGDNKAGKAISYRNVARITDVRFGVEPKASLNIAAGLGKAPINRIYGKWKNIPGQSMTEQAENAKALVQEIVDDPSYVQVGMNPFRHSYFYDRNTDIGRPIVSADEVIQVGGLVYAKNPVYGNWTDESYRVKGMLDAAGAPVQFSRGNRMESSKDFKLAAFVMREKADGAPMSEIVSGIASVFPNMSPQEIKDLVDDPETWLRNKYANLSKAMQDNLIARARVKNIYAPRTGAVAPAFQGLEVPMAKIEEATQAPTFKERVDKVFTNFKNKFIDPAKGLPDWIISLKDFAGGTKQIEISRAELTIRQLKEVAKKIGFKDWDTFAAALKSIPQPIQQPVGAGTGMVGFNPSVAAAGAPYTIPNSMLPQTTPPAVQALPLEIIPFVYKMRGQIDGLTKDLIASGYVTPEQAAKLESNIGQYVNRAYRLYNEKGWRPDQDQIRETTKFLADQYIKQLATDNAGVLTYEQIEKQAIEKAKRDVNEILDKKTNPYFAAKSESRNMGILKERKDIPEPIRKLMGEYTDPGTVFIMTVAKQAALKASSEYLTKVRNMGMGTLFFEENDPNRPASASVQIAAEGSDTKSPLNGLYTMPEVAEAMETVNPTYNEVVNLWMKAVGAVRWGKTVGSVKTQLLNFESNLGFAVMNGLLMTGATGKAFNASRKYVGGQYSNKELSDITQKVIQLGLVGQGVNATELAKMLGSGDIHDIALDLAVNPDSKYRMVKKAPGKALGVLNKLYRMGDDFWKVYAYMNERELVAGAMFDKKYADLTDQEQADVDIESSERVKSTWPTYDRVFPAVKAISQNTPIFGNFISFRAESIRVLANTIAMAIKDMKTPGFEGIGARRMAGILSYIAIRTGATYAFAQAVGMAASGLTGLLFGGDDEEERKKRAFKQAAPSFMATQDIAVIPTKDKHRFVVYSLSGIDPYNTTFNTLNALTDGTATKEPGPAAAFAEFFGGFLSPEMTFNTVWSIITNTDPKSGNRIVGKTDEGADAYAKIGAYLFDELKPSTISMVQRLAGDNPSAELASLVGARPYEIDLHKSFSFALSDMARQMKEINDEYSFVQFNKKATEDEKALAQKEAEQKKALLIERMNQRFNDFVLIGANPEELRKLIFDRSPIKTTGFDQQTKFGIINGNVNKELLFK